jgi:ferredoxin
VNIRSEPTHRVSIYMAGDLVTAHRVLRDFCYGIGACFTITPTKFIYTGGEEDGFVVGLVNYPRFPSELRDLQSRAVQLGGMLMAACNQRTALIVGDESTDWLVREPPGAA